MRAAVADTSPLRYLVLIGAVEVLPRLFETVAMPDAVHAELLHARMPAAARRWANALPAWLTVMAAPVDAGSDLRLIDAGERAAIALASVSRPDPLLVDDRAAVAVAQARGLAVTDTLGLLDRAAQHGLVDLQAAFAALRATNFHVRQELLEFLLARARERRTAR